VPPRSQGTGKGKVASSSRIRPVLGGSTNGGLPYPNSCIPSPALYGGETVVASLGGPMTAEPRLAIIRCMWAPRSVWRLARRYLSVPEGFR
jgi:hypothetical protein